MKLNPPASSSDVEVAREIARRLHHHRRREDRPTPPTAAPPDRLPEPGAGVHVPAPEPAARAEPAPAAEEPRRPLPFEPPARPLREQQQTTAPMPLAEPISEAEPMPTYGATEPTPPEGRPDSGGWEKVSPTELPLDAPPLAAEDGARLGEPAPPSWDEQPAADPVAGGEDSEDPLGALTPPPDLEAFSGNGGGGADVPVELEDEEPDGVPGPPPIDVAVAAPVVAGEHAAPDGTPEEELFDAPPAPSWEDIADNCMRVAGARGAMLVDPAGQVFAARGTWPEPGPQAIAGRLVAMMDRALRDAPTRSVSAPVAGMHLTAWRIPTSGGLITTALVADAPVRAELRQVVDTEIHRAAGS